MDVKIMSRSSEKVSERHLRELVNMLAWMEVCGSIGHSVNFRVNYDGDGSARLLFDFGINQEQYESLKTEILKDYFGCRTEPKVFSFD